MEIFDFLTICKITAFGKDFFYERSWLAYIGGIELDSEIRV
jgi:hypothetical protein